MVLEFFWRNDFFNLLHEARTRKLFYLTRVFSEALFLRKSNQAPLSKEGTRLWRAGLCFSASQIKPPFQRGCPPLAGGGLWGFAFKCGAKRRRRALYARFDRRCRNPENPPFTAALKIPGLSSAIDIRLSFIAMQKTFIDLPPFGAACGEVRLPGSKSISNRVLLLAALAEGETQVRDLLVSDDTERMLDALRALGVELRADADDPTAWNVHGCGGAFPVKEADLFLGNAGTAFRPLTAALAFCGGHYRLSGVARMHERPIGDLVDALCAIGAEIGYSGAAGYPPLEIKPGRFTANNADGVLCARVRGDVSSQFLTGLLLALPLSGMPACVEVEGELISKPYIGITLATMARFGVRVEHENWSRFLIPAGSRYRSPGTIHVEGDASSASYFLALGAIGGGPVRVQGVGRDSIQGDVAFAAALEKMGARIEMGENWIEARGPENCAGNCAEPASGSLSGLRGITLDGNEIPDAAMTLATTALFASGTTRLTNIGSWRVKETDRIAAMAKELRKLGAAVEEGADFIAVTPPAALSSPPEGIDTYDDHRIAMCFSLAARGTALRINDPGCVAKTFPDYFAQMRAVAVSVPVIAIDGPSASGKGTVAALAAKALGWHYLDSGLLYRLAALAAHRAGTSLDDEAALAQIAANLDVCFEEGAVFLEGALVGEELRGEEIGAKASRIAALPAVRAALVFRQRALRRAPGLVADGRDMGCTIFPDAALKVFLTASAEIRAGRRTKQLIEKGIQAKIEDILLDLRQRDERDSQRDVAPLRQNADARFLDTSRRSIAEAVEQVLEWWGNAEQQDQSI